ncbi:hypothetical protein FJ365_03955 [Candidatus Dependentiae bacterium]|nr:hypothetical protein [Candidatus Dependentiae bacterium]
MLEIIHGVVVKNPIIGSPQFCLLTEEYGKIPVIAFKHHQRTRMGLGNFVQSVVLHDQHNSFIVQSVELLAQPTLNYKNLGWFHHLLEISYFFCPMHQPASEVYTTLQTSLKLLLIEISEREAIQLSLIGHLLILFGFYPPPHFAEALNSIKPLLAMTIDFQAPQNLQLLKQSAAMLQEQDLSQYHTWLLACINSHPRISGFKTLPFVYKSI